MSCGRWALALLVLAGFGALGPGCRGAAAPEPISGSCSLRTSSRDRASLAGLFAAARGPIVLIGDSAGTCSCAVRTLGGDREARSLGGDSEARSLGGDREARSLGGDSEARSLGGDRETRSLGGDREARSLGGDREARSLGGDREARSLGGDREARSLGGDREARSLGGDREARSLGGDREARSLGGDASEVACVVEPGCAGFVIVSDLPVELYDGRQLRSVRKGCVEL